MDLFFLCVARVAREAVQGRARAGAAVAALLAGRPPATQQRCPYTTSVARPGSARTLPPRRAPPRARFVVWSRPRDATGRPRHPQVPRRPHPPALGTYRLFRPQGPHLDRHSAFASMAPRRKCSGMAKKKKKKERNKLFFQNRLKWKLNNGRSASRIETIFCEIEIIF